MAVRSLTQDDLRWLVCPACRQPLRFSSTPASIQCLGCSRLYPIVEGLPVLLASQDSAQ